MASSERGPAVVLHDVVLVAGEAACAGGIALRVVQRVVAEQGQLRAKPYVRVHDQLLLAEDSFRFVLINISNMAQRTHTARRIGGIERSRKWGIHVPR